MKMNLRSIFYNKSGNLRTGLVLGFVWFFLITEACYLLIYIGHDHEIHILESVYDDKYLDAL